MAVVSLTASELYTLAVGSALLLFFVWQLAAALASWRSKCLSLARKYVGQSILVRRFDGSSELTVDDCLAIAALVAANIVTCSVSIRSLTDCASRLGTLALANLIPLYLGGPTSLWVHTILGLPLRKYGLLHRWLGRICALEAVLHGTLAISKHSWRFSIVQSMILGMLSALLLASFLYIRRRFYEAFKTSHYLLVIGINVCLWIHIEKGINFHTLCLSLATTLWLTQTLARLVILILRNMGSKPCIESEIMFPSRVDGAAQAVLLKIPLKRPWKLAHGQYVYITLPSLSSDTFGIFQAHPYLIAWASEDMHQRAEAVHLLVHCREGFSRKLRAIPQKAFDVIVDGPYGKGPSLDAYDKVLLIACGVGVAAHLLAIKHLLQAHDNRTARVRRVTLLWVLGREAHEQWARHFIDSLMESDKRRIFLVFVAVSGAGSKPASNIHKVVRERYIRLEGQVDVKWLVGKEWDAEAGNMAISLCGTPLFEREVRRALRCIPQDIHLFTSAFQMDELHIEQQLDVHS